MSIQKYEAFLKIVETGSLTKAATALGYTQSGISHMLSALEKEWNITLLSRDRAGVSVTAEGLQLLPFVQNICRATVISSISLASFTAWKPALFA